MRGGSKGQHGRGKQQQKRREGQQRGASGGRQGSGKWSMPGFNVEPGSAMMVAGNYVVKAAQTQIILQGAAGREIWLGVGLCRGGVNLTGWMHMDAQW